MNRLSKNVIKLHGFNPGPKTLSGNNIYLLGRDQNRTLLDAGEQNNSEFLNLLKQTLASEKCKLDKLLITHYHPDHTEGALAISKLGSEFLTENFKIYKAALNGSDFEKNMTAANFPPSDPLVDIFRTRLSEVGAIHDLEFDFQFDHIFHGDTFRIDSEHDIQALFTPGHAKDHMCFYFPAENALFTGDNILGGSSAVVEDLNIYLRSLENMKQTGAEILYPAHGPVENFDTFDKYLNHRRKRIQEILKFFQTNFETNSNQHLPLSPEDFVKNIYIPQGLDPKLFLPACGNVLVCLIKLCVDGKIVRREDVSEYHFQMKS